MGKVTGKKRRRKDDPNDPKVKQPKKKKKRGVVAEKKKKKWKGWKSIYLCGTELDDYDKAFEYDWDFSHLHKDLKSGKLRGNSKLVFVFGATEPQLVPVEGNEDGEIVQIPVYVCVVGDVPPPEKLGCMSVQKKEEEIIDFQDLKFSWSPFIQEENKEEKKKKKGKRHNTQRIFHLNCKLRKSALKMIKEKKKITYSYLLPYIFRPKDLLKEEVDATFVTGFYRIDNGGMVNFDIDFLLPNKEKIQYLKRLMQDYELEPRHKVGLKTKIKESIAQAKLSYEKKKANNQKKYNEIPEELREGLDNLKCYKYYPKTCKECPNVESFQTSFINRYFGKAEEVYPILEEDETDMWGEAKK